MKFQCSESNIIPVITFITLSNNSSRYLKRCFDNINNKCLYEKISHEVIIIDNGSIDCSVDIISDYLRNNHNHYCLIKLDKNSGTTYSRNLGLKQARGEYICILDSDTEFGEGSLEAAISRLSMDKSIGILAPRIVLPDGTVQNSVKRFPTMSNKIMKIPQIIFGVKTRNRDFYEDFPFNEERRVDSAISACWFLRKDLVQRVGNLDEKIFYAPEDLDYSLRVRKAGYSILYYPEFSVLHHTQQITHKNPFSKTALSHFKGLIYYYCKHGGWFKRPSLS